MVSAKRTPSPAFQFYAREFLSSDKVSRMSLADVGAYTLLLCHAWLSVGLPDDHKKIAGYLHISVARFERLWAGPLGECFELRHGRLMNPKQERIRHTLDEFRAEQARKGRMGGRPHKPRVCPGKATGLPNESSPTASASSSASVEKNVQELEGSALLMFITVGEPPSWGLSQDRITKWQSTYPNLDVAGQCRRAQTWLDANPLKRKTASGMPRFLVNWLNNAVDRPHGSGADSNGRGRTGAPPRGKYDGIEEHD